jgi:ribonuclease HII
MADYEIEKSLLSRNYKNICGVDEVGRGALFGPVVSGAVILNSDTLHPDIKDSKKLTPKRRQEMARFIYTHARAFSIGWCWNDEIDELNILEATKKSMKKAVCGLKISPDYVLIDGMKPDFLDVAGDAIVKGDNRCMSIAAASIIAKVCRDDLMISFARFFPEYGLSRNKGYPTGAHINAIRTFGRSQFHRVSFKV